MRASRTQEYTANPSTLRDEASGNPSPHAHSELLDVTLPLLAQCWQKDRLWLGSNGDFPDRPSGMRERPLAVDLRHADRPSLLRLTDAQTVLSYSQNALNAAKAALIAAASQGGRPIAADQKSLALLTLAQRIADSEIPVLLEGPTGTGKEVISRFVHDMSERRDGPFVAVNCAAMPEAMLEGLLFGHRKGAFTGAGEAREGLFQAADRGTLLLDEIGELPLILQAKLLRTLQEGEVLPLGATKPIKVDVRIVAATNRTLTSEVEAGRFREDLLYRLNVFPMDLPALRDRRGDVAPLAFGMLLRHACNSNTPRWISGQAITLLENHAWPGNVRELENVIRRAILLAGTEECIGSEHIVFDQPVRSLDSAPRYSSGPTGVSTLSDVAFQSEAQAILDALDQNRGHRGKTARSLGISERTLRYRLASMRECGLMASGGEA